MALRGFASLLLLLCLLSAAPAAAAAPPGYTLVRVTARGDLTGRTEVAIYKAYAGDAGPIRDIIPMPGPGPDFNGYPRVIELQTTGPLQAVREPGRIVVESTGPGQSTVSILVLSDRTYTDWPVQMHAAEGVGPIYANISVQLPPGVRASREHNGVTLFGEGRPPGPKRLDRLDQYGWSFNQELPASQHLMVSIGFSPVPTAPLWVAQLALGVGAVALLLSGYLFWQSRQKAA